MTLELATDYKMFLIDSTFRNCLRYIYFSLKKTNCKTKSVQARLSHRRLRVVRIETTVDTQRIVGLLVPNAAVETVLQGSLSLKDLSTTSSSLFYSTWDS